MKTQSDGISDKKKEGKIKQLRKSQKERARDFFEQKSSGGQRGQEKLLFHVGGTVSSIVNEFA